MRTTHSRSSLPSARSCARLSSSPSAGHNAMAEWGKIVGAPMDRVDGRLKVTGGARYAAEFSAPRLAHGVLHQSTIASGRIRDLDTAAAEGAPRVIAVITHRNIPGMPRPSVRPAVERLRLLIP